MSVVERSVIVPLSLEETWEVFNGNEVQNLVASHTKPPVDCIEACRPNR